MSKNFSDLKTFKGYLKRPDGSTIAYQKTAGMSPGVLFLGGFRSDMNGTKVLSVEEFCKKRGQAVVRFDYFGHGDSSGRFEDGTIGRWTKDALAVIDEVTEGPQILIGSSMGGWIMILAALARLNRIVGLLGIAAAPDFTEDLINAALTAEQTASIGMRGYCTISTPYDEEPYLITKKLIDDGKQNLLLGKKIDLDMPIRLIHGMNDNDVPWETAHNIMDSIESEDVEVQFIKGGDHRLSSAADLNRLSWTLEALLRFVE